MPQPSLSPTPDTASPRPIPAKLCFLATKDSSKCPLDGCLGWRNWRDRVFGLRGSGSEGLGLCNESYCFGCRHLALWWVLPANVPTTTFSLNVTLPTSSSSDEQPKSRVCKLQTSEISRNFEDILEPNIQVEQLNAGVQEPRKPHNEGLPVKFIHRICRLCLWEFPR